MKITNRYTVNWRLNRLIVTAMMSLFVITGCAGIVTKNDFPLHQGIYTLYHPKAMNLLNLNAELITLADGFAWAEGPVWIENGNYLLFSDIPNNKVYQYSAEYGLKQFLAPSGFSNGLVLNGEELVLMQSRSRQISVLASKLNKPTQSFRVLATHYQGNRLNSPNDGALHSNGSLFFTDPPYGLAKQMADPEKELSFQGVYVLKPNGKLQLIDSKLSYPNGIALSPKQEYLYVAVSDKSNPAWYRYQLNEKGEVLNKSLFLEPHQARTSGINEQGTPDGLKVHSSGVVFATGPGGVWVFDDNKVLLAHIAMPGFTANLAFDDIESTLYLTAENELRALSLR